MPIITDVVGDIFAAPAGSILIHACNAKGIWGSGVALAFKKRYPQAFKTYTTHCKSPPTGTPLTIHQRSLAGTCLLIPPTSSPKPKTPSHYIACLITSVGYGKNVDGADTILRNTASALRDLEAEIASLRGQGWEGEVWAVRINSGRFGVEWGRTRKVLEDGGVGVRVVVVEGEGGGEGGDVMVTQPARGEEDKDDSEGIEDSGRKRKLRESDESEHVKRARVVGNIKGVDTTTQPKPERGKRTKVADDGAGDGDHAKAKANISKRRSKRAVEDT